MKELNTSQEKEEQKMFEEYEKKLASTMWKGLGIFFIIAIVGVLVWLVINK